VDFKEPQEEEIKDADELNIEYEEDGEDF